MAVSYGMLGILLMLDVCFLVNFLVVRALRKWTDKMTVSAMSAESQRSFLPEQEQSSDILYNNFKPVFDAFKSHEDFAVAWIFGSVKLSPMVVKKFPEWKPIPWNLGLWSTCLFVILGVTLLSDDLVTEHIGVTSGSLDADLCIQEDQADGINELRRFLLEMTNLEVARKQHRMMVDFHEALINDTSLYGVDPYECPELSDGMSGRKEDWNDPSKGEFFPGYCGEALEAAIDAAQNRTCVNEVCDCPTLPDTGVFQVVGLADKRFCGEVCIEVPYPCPKHTADAEQELEDYRYQQYVMAEKEREDTLGSNPFPTTVTQNLQSAALQTAEKILHQVDIASYIYIGYSLLSLFFPSPLVLFRMPYWTLAKRFLFGVQKPFFIVSVIAVWWGVEYFQELRYSPDIQLFLNNLRAGDPCFVDSGYLLERQRVLNDICTELVPMQPQWNASSLTIQDILVEVGHFAESCDCKFPNQFLYDVASPDVTSAENASSIGFKSTPVDLCDGLGGGCPFFVPEKDASFLGNSSICMNGTEARKLVLEAPDSGASWYDLWISSGFLATLVVKIAVANFGLALMTLADPFVICAGEFLWVPSDFGFEVLNSAGEREQVLVDVFSQANQLGPAVLEQWMDSKLRALFHIGMSKVVVWGFFVHLSMFNLFASVYEEVESGSNIAQQLEQNDLTVLIACAAFAGLVVCCGCYVLCFRLRNYDYPGDERQEHDYEDYEEAEVIHAQAEEDLTLMETDKKHDSGTDEEAEETKVVDDQKVEKGN